MNSYLQKFLFESYIQGDEHIITVMHRHLWPVWPRFFVEFVSYIFFPLTLSYFFQHQYVLWGTLAMIVFGLIHILYDFVDWYADVFILTDKNLIILHWNGIFKIESLRIDYEEIESIQVSKNGIFQGIFGYGDVSIETANESINANMKDVINVNYCQAKILDMKHYKQKNDDENMQHDVHSFKQALREFMKEYTTKRFR
jgi:uncharacterized membrane protein YdbT with pleckstrin-like domain